MQVCLSLLCDSSNLLHYIPTRMHLSLTTETPLIIIYATGCLYSLQFRLCLAFNTRFCYDLLSDLSTGRMGSRIAACIWGPYKGEEFSRTPGAGEVGWGDVCHTWVRALTQALGQHWVWSLSAPAEVPRNQKPGFCNPDHTAWITVTGAGWWNTEHGNSD